MELKLWIRDLAVMVPLIAAQWGIWMAFRRWRLWAANTYAVLAAIALLINFFNNLWLLNIHFSGLFGAFISNGDGVGQTFLLTLFAAYVVYLCCRLIERTVPKETSPRRRQLLKTAGAMAVASPIIGMSYGILVGRVDFGIREVSLPIPGLHPDLEGLRILQLSDIHLGQFLSPRELERVIDMTNGLRPHLALMTGDLISKHGDPMEECVRQLARVRADAGMLGCMGNHEMYAQVEAAVKTEAARRGIPFLRHEQRELRFGGAVLNIGGVDYQKSSLRSDYLKGAEQLTRPGALNLLMSHNPDVFPVAAKQGWDLTLSGHTHGGQITVEIVEQTVNIARFITPYVMGEYHLGKASCYVTRGIGTVGVPARVGVPPEITLLRLRKA